MAANYFDVDFLLSDGPPDNPAFGLRELVPDVEGYLTGLVVSGTYSNTQPVTEPADVQVGNYAPAFGFLDFYNRIHLQYTVLGLGAVVSNSEVPFRVFNAYLVPKTLEDLTGVNDDGLTIIQPDTPPYDFAPLQELTYTLQASADGPPVIEATYTFDFGAEILEMVVTGIRVLGWRWSPNWDGGLKERLEWLTDVEESRDASELRRQLRSAPRQFLDFNFDVSDREKRIVESTLYNWGARTWVLPFWPDGDVLAAPVTVGTTEIPLDTVGRLYRAGDLIMLIALNDTAHEAIEIESVSSTEIVLKRPVSALWPAGSMIFPARLAVIENVLELRRFLQTYGYGTVNFRCTKTLPGTALVESTYRGYPILVDDPNWEGDPALQFERKLSVLDPSVGPATVMDLSGIPAFSQGLQWTALNRTEVTQLRQWLYARAGRAKGIWVPTFSDDLTLVEIVGAAGTTIDVAFAGITEGAATDVNRRDIRITMNDGTTYYRRVSGAVVVDDDTERLTIDSAFGTEIDPVDVHMISWMALCRLDSDLVELDWKNNFILDASLTLRSYRSDV